MKSLLLCILGMLVPATLIAYENPGWTLGVGVVASNEYADDPGGGGFPTLRDGDRQYMFLPNISYHWSNWTMGAEGIQWQNKEDEGLAATAKVSFPESALGVRGTEGWFQYGATTGINYSDQRSVFFEAKAGPFSLRTDQGYSKDTKGEQQHQISIGAPLYIGAEGGLVVIGSGKWFFQNSAFTLREYGQTSLNKQEYLHQSLELFAIFGVSDRLSLLTSIDYRWNDPNLLQQDPSLPETQNSLFFMLSYFLGKHAD